MDNISISSRGAARTICQNLGADLIVIKTEEENQQLVEPGKAAVTEGGLG